MSKEQPKRKINHIRSLHRQQNKLSQTYNTSTQPPLVGKPGLRKMSSTSNLIPLQKHINPSPIRVRSSSPNININQNPKHPPVFFNTQKSKRAGRISQQKREFSYQNQLNSQFSQLQISQQANLLIGKYKIAQKYFSKIIKKNKNQQQILKQIKQAYQNYQNFLQKQQQQPNDQKPLIRLAELQMRQKKYIKLLKILKQKGYPVQDIYYSQRSSGSNSSQHSTSLTMRTNQKEIIDIKKPPSEDFICQLSEDSECWNTHLEQAKSQRQMKRGQSQTRLRQSTQQRQMIEALKTQTNKLKEQLCLDSLQNSNLGIESQIARLQEQGDTFARKIQLQQKKISELDSKIAQMTEKLRIQRESMGGTQGTKQTSQGIQKKIKGLQNKLDKSLQKYNQAIAHNKQLRDQIDKLRRQRVVYDGIYKKLQEELQQKKQEMYAAVQRSKMAQKKRDQARRKMQKIKLEAQQEQEEFNIEWNQLGKIIQEDKKKISFRESESPSSESERSDITDLKKKVVTSAWNIAKQKATIRSYLQKVQHYQEAFKKIQEATGISDIDELVSTFVQAQMQNYSLLNHVNQLSTEMDKLDQQIHEIKIQIEKYKGSTNSFEGHRKTEMKKLEFRLNRTLEKTAEQEQLYKQNLQEVHKLMPMIEEMFHKLGCELELPLQPGPIKINEGNILDFMAKIEEKANQIIDNSTVFYPEQQDYFQYQTSANYQKADLELPSVPDRENPQDQESALPMTKQEMKIKIQHLLEGETEERRKRKQKLIFQ